MLTDCGYMIFDGQEPTLYSLESIEEVDFSLTDSYSFSLVEFLSISLEGSYGPVYCYLEMKGCSFAIIGVHLVSLSNLNTPLRKSMKALIVFSSVSVIVTLNCGCYSKYIPNLSASYLFFFSLNNCIRSSREDNLMYLFGGSNLYPVNL